MTSRWIGLLLVAGCVVGCGDDTGGGAADACAPACTDRDAAMPVDSGMDASMTPTEQPEMFMCPMDGGGTGALECTVPKLNVDYLRDAGITMLGPIPIDLAGTVVVPKGCCTDDVTCGVTVPMLTPGDICFEQNQLGDKDGQCPDEVLTIGTDTKIPIPGCCKPTNECGLDLTPLGLGCGERGVLIGLVTSSVGGRLPDGGLQGSLPCSYGNPARHDDGGSDDAGN